MAAHTADYTNSAMRSAAAIAAQSGRQTIYRDDIDAAMGLRLFPRPVDPQERPDDDTVLEDDDRDELVPCPDKSESESDDLSATLHANRPRAGCGPAAACAC